jgi:N-acetylglucosamine-6-phosphate deacetylase
MSGSLTGRDVATGHVVRVEFSDVIGQVTAGSGSSDAYVAPGWVDLQVNGFAGVDFNRPDTPLSETARALEAVLATGTTRFYPTVITGPPQAMVAALRNLADARALLPEGEAMDGFHVEGPAISPDDGPRGAHPRQWVRGPDLDEFHRWQDATRGAIRIVTLAPEWPGAPAYIESLAGAGIVVSIGHTNATTEQIADAVAAGASMSTHLGNAAHPVLPRHANYIWDQLAEDRLAASFIVDGIHLGRSFLRAALRAKGVARSVLVTDASAPAGANPGRYSLGDQLVDLTSDGRVVLAGQDRLAGSALRMDHGVANLVTEGGLSLAQAVMMATANPARIGRVPGRARGFTPGDRADLVLFTFDAEHGTVQVLETYLGGRQVFRSPFTV